jgi:predicted unusual protein kinase regulating ubiquinone biosynthesis (AarF/ABC1/UbiB family)
MTSFIYWEIVVPKLGLARLANRTRDDRNRRTAVRFRSLAISMGGLMIKVGQFLSARLDILPAEITDELSGLQDEVPAAEFEDIRRQAEAELGRTLSAAFASFESTPLAAASLGQAHRAVLLPDDAENAGFSNVVVKVQRPSIDKIVAVDLSALRRVGGWMTRYKPVSSRADVPALVEEFAVTTLAEIDYLAEAGNAENFREAFEADERVRVPQVAWEQTTLRVLTLEDVSAIRLGDYEAITAAGIDRGEVADKLVATYLQQIFEDGGVPRRPAPGKPVRDPAGPAR